MAVIVGFLLGMSKVILAGAIVAFVGLIDVVIFLLVGKRDAK